MSQENITRTRRYDSGKTTIRENKIEELPHRQIIAMYEGKCERCLKCIKPGDPIIGAYINGQGHSWDCWGKCGYPGGLHEETRDGEVVTLKHVHENSVYWLHRDCTVAPERLRISLIEPIDLEIGNWEQIEVQKSKWKILKTARINEKLMKFKPMIWSEQDRAVIVLRTPLRMKIEERRRKETVKYVDGVKRIEIWENIGWVRVLSDVYCQKIKVCKISQIVKITQATEK